MSDPRIPADAPVLAHVPVDDQSREQLRGNIGVPGIVFLVVAAAAPLTAIGGALPVMLAIGNGAGTPSAYLVISGVLLLFSVGYAAMSRHIVDTGAFFAYVRAGLGEHVGTGAAGLALLTYNAIQAGIYGLAAVTASDLIASWGGPHLPWWALALGLLVVVAVLGYRSIDVGVRVLGVMLVMEVGVVAAITIAILVRGGANGIEFSSFTPHAFLSGSPGIALMFAIASFIGFEATAIYGEEARDPQRTVPRSTYIAVGLIGVLYAVASWAVVLAYGAANVVAAAQADPTGLTLSAADQYLFSWSSKVIEVMLLTSLFAALLAFHNAVARYLYALGRRGAAPRAMGRSHIRFGSPHIGSVAQTVLAAALIVVFAVFGLDPILQVFTWMSGLATMTMIVLMLLTSVAIPVYFVRTRTDTRMWHTRIAPALSIAGLSLVAVAAIANFTTLIGGSSALAAVMYVAIGVAFAAGALAVMVSGRSKP